MRQGMESEWLNKLNHQVVGAAMEVHRQLGQGLPKRIYIACLGEELRTQGLETQSDVRFPVRYGNWRLDDAFRVSLLVEDALLVEVKAPKRLRPLHSAQLSTYLKLSGFPLGLLINFNVEDLRRGILRILNEPCPPALISPSNNFNAP